jgi:hypothetical protein
MNTSDTLNLAADLIEQRGWTKGQGWNDSTNRPLCLEGGIMAALGWSFGSADYDPLELWDCPAYRAVQAYLNFSHDKALASPRHHYPSPVDPLWRWNDFSSAASEVIEVLRAAAVVEAARETEAAPVEVSA